MSSAPQFPQLPDLDFADGALRHVLARTEGILYTLADAVVSSSPPPDAGDAVVTAKDGDWLSGITSYMETILKVLKDGLSALHVPYAYGFAIILLTVLVKAATFPLTKKQVESALAMRSLQPQLKAIQQRYAGDQERIQLETARLYKLAGVNPLAGCLPTLATIPVWIGLYRALSNVADEGLLTEGFFWIPSLSGPTTIAARQSGSGISWLFPFIDGHPPLGWSDTVAYLVLPVLLVVSQYISAQMMQPSQADDPSQKSSQAVTKFLPLMIGYFALSVPSGLSLYWFTNNILSTAQQIWLQKLGGAKNPLRQFSDNSMIREEPSDIQKSVLNIKKSVVEDETEKVVSSGVKADSGGLRPGERFKQLKEQEARRKKQREEGKENMTAVDAVVEQTISEVKLVENREEQETGNNRTKTQYSSSNNGVANDLIVNGDQSSHDNLQKDQVPQKHASTGDQSTAHDTLDERCQEMDTDEA